MTTDRHALGEGKLKKLILLLQDIEALIKREKASLIIILFSLGFSVCVSVSMVSFAASRSIVLQRMREDRATYRISFNASFLSKKQMTPMEAFDDFFMGDDSPVLADISYYALSFSLYPVNNQTITYDSRNHDANTSSDLARQQNISWRSYFPDDRLMALAEQEEERILLEGRWFTEEELQKGSAVAVVGKDSFPNAKQGDRIRILDHEATVIGVRKKNNAIPYRLMQSLSKADKGFIPDPFICVFKEPLSEEQQKRLGNAGADINCLFDIRKNGYYFEILLILLIIGGTFLLAVLNILNMYRHLIMKSRYRFMAQKVCGAGRNFIFWGLYLTPLLVSAVSTAAGIMLYRFLFEPIIVRYFKYPVLSIRQLLAVFIVILILCFLALLPTARRIIKAQPADMALWR